MKSLLLTPLLLSGILTAQERPDKAPKLAPAEANRKQKGIIETESGLQYRMVAAGEGSPLGGEGLTGKEIFVMNYRGTLPDGT